MRAARALRRQRAVRWFRLAGHAPFPMAFEMDDEPPAALTAEGVNHAHPGQTGQTGQAGRPDETGRAG